MMIRRLVLALALWIAALLPASACVLPITLINGTVADASQVMQNFTALLSCVNSGGATAWSNITGTPSTLAGYGVATISNTPIVGGTVSGGTALSGVALTTSTWTGGAITGLSDPTNAADAATKSYVDANAGGLVFQAQVKWATTAALATSTYANGASGVGATITITANGACAVDSGAPALAERVLVKNQAAAAQNGAYAVSTAGDGSTQCVYTRVTDWDQSAEMVKGSAFFVTSGTANTSTTWAMNSAALPTVGTTSITFVQSGASSTYAADGSSLNLTASTFSIKAPVSIANGGSNTTSQTTNGLAYYDGTKITTGSVFTLASSLLTAASGNIKTTGTGLHWAAGNQDVNASGIYTGWALPTYSGIISNQSYALSGAGNIFQTASVLSSSGTMNATALYGEGDATGSGSGVWGLNTVAKCTVNASNCVSIEADVAITTPTATNALGILVSTSQLSCVPTGVNNSCHPNTAYQVNNNVAAGDVTAYTGHANNLGYIPSFNIGTLFSSSTLTVSGTTRTFPAINGVLIQACCYNSSIGGLGTITPTVTGIEFTTATFSGQEISTSNFLAGATVSSFTSRVQVTGSVVGSSNRPLVSINGETNKGITLAGNGTGAIHIGDIGTQTGVCVTPAAAGNAPLLASCGSSVGLTISAGTNQAVGFNVPLGFPTFGVDSLPACSTGWRAFVTDANSSTFNAGAVSGGSNRVPVFCASGNWKIG